MERYIAFLKVLETGSFTKAAALLGYTQPALSQMIASLEKELQVKLLRRSRTGVSLTPEGAQLLAPIQSSVEQYLAMRRAANEVRGLERGLVRIGCISSVSCHWLPQVIRRFWQDHPGVQVVLHQGDYTSIPEWVREGRVDFGFVNPAAVRSMPTLPVKSGEFRAVVPKDNPLAKQDHVTLEQLAAQDFLLLEEGDYSEPLEAFSAQGLTPRVRLRMHDDYSILSMVEQGLGVSVLAELVLRKTAYDVAILPIEPAVTRTLAVTYKDEKALPLASKEFISYLMDSRDDL